MKYRKSIAGVAIFAIQASMLPFASAAFTDVDTSLSAKLEVLMQKQIVSQNNANLFRPDSNLNRAEALKLILKASQVFKETQVKDIELNFADISGEDWYTPYLKAGASFGIIKGYGDNTIKLGNNVTKAEFLTMLFRMHYALLGTELTASRESISFNDVQPSDWSYPAVKWASTTFLIPAGISFNPNKELTRAETAEIVYSYVNALNTMPNQAFGKIALGENPERSQSGGGMGAGGGLSVDGSAPLTESGANMIDKIRAPEPQTNITFTFSGAALTDIPASMPVYKSIPKSVQMIMTSKLQDIVPKEFVKFFGGNSSLEVNNISFSDGVTGGYQYYLDLSNANYSMYEDWTKMTIQNTPEVYGLKTEPNAAALAQLAQNFLAQKGVSLEGYAPGEVDMSWKNYIPYNSNEEYPFPQYYTVNFPRMIDGKKVMSEWGYYDSAITVGINAATMKVNSVNGMINKEVIASNYDTKSWNEIVAGALKGGLHMPYVPYYYYGTPDATTMPAADGGTVTPPSLPADITVTLTRAEQAEVLVRQYSRNDYYTAPNEFFVPAVVFTGTFPTPAGSTAPAQEVKVVVPTIKDDAFIMPENPPIMYLKDTAEAQG
ncbi:MAG: S-layer homology domain-containing protein [Candidatus Gracilibacteria bacterium]